MQENSLKPHSIIMEDRKSLSVTGALDVAGFNEEVINIITSQGDMIVTGAKLHISKLSLESGEVEIDGVIDSLRYTAAKRNKSFMQRIFSWWNLPSRRSCGRLSTLFPWARLSRRCMSPFGFCVRA